MKVLFAASECAPLVKVGGLADVVGGLPKALKKLGVEVVIAIPKYESIQIIDNSQQTIINVEFAGKTESVSVYQTVLPGTSIIVYLFENAKYLSTGPAYCAKSAEGSSLDIDRFSFFSKAVVEFLRFKSEVLSPNIIHCHDWHTAWIPLLLKQSVTTASKPKTLLTIHNMGKQYQGRTSGEVVEKLGISPSVIASPEGAWQSQVNILLQGIINADLINTVSPSYAKEIQTNEYGEDLHDILIQYNNKLTGILNGIDYEVWNPETDKNLVTNYSSNITSWSEGKKNNKFSLLTKVGLPSGENIPTFGMVTRIAEQKGFEILLPALEKLFSNSDARVIILGVGDPTIEDRVKKIEDRYKEKLKFITRFDEVLAHLIYSGSDFFLVPSSFEPSGLTQLVAMRYGTLPIVRKTGGLADSVEDGKTGFVFEEYISEALLKKMEEAMEVYSVRRTLYNDMVGQAMQKDFSWDKSAGEYLKLYEKLLAELFFYGEQQAKKVKIKEKDVNKIIADYRRTHLIF